MGSEARLHYAPREGVTPDDELRALSQVYAFVLQKHEEKKKGAQTGTPDDAKEDQIVRADRESIP